MRRAKCHLGVAVRHNSLPSQMEGSCRQRCQTRHRARRCGAGCSLPCHSTQSRRQRDSPARNTWASRSRLPHLEYGHSKPPTEQQAVIGVAGMCVQGCIGQHRQPAICNGAALTLQPCHVAGRPELAESGTPLHRHMPRQPVLAGVIFRGSCNEVGIIVHACQRLKIGHLLDTECGNGCRCVRGGI